MKIVGYSIVVGVGRIWIFGGVVHWKFAFLAHLTEWRGLTLAGKDVCLHCAGRWLLIVLV